LNIAWTTASGDSYSAIAATAKIEMIEIIAGNAIKSCLSGKPLVIEKIPVGIEKEYLGYG
jgi:hypothetical protein